VCLHLTVSLPLRTPVIGLKVHLILARLHFNLNVSEKVLFPKRIIIAVLEFRTWPLSFQSLTAHLHLMWLVMLLEWGVLPMIQVKAHDQNLVTLVSTHHE
jgi:hypothetical protein